MSFERPCRQINLQCTETVYGMEIRINVSIQDAQSTKEKVGKWISALDRNAQEKKKSLLLQKMLSECGQNSARHEHTLLKTT